MLNNFQMSNHSKRALDGFHDIPDIEMMWYWNRHMGHRCIVAEPGKKSMEANEESVLNGIRHVRQA